MVVLLSLGYFPAADWYLKILSYVPPWNHIVIFYRNKQTI